MSSPKPIIDRLLTFEELCEGRFFRVPDYQRGYAWEPEQVKDLLADIERIDSSRDYRHFTGTVVLLDPKGQAAESSRLEIVDGQQRLTTLIMILARLESGGGLSMEVSQYISQTYLERGEKRNAERVLHLNQATDRHFHSYVIDGRLDHPDPTMVSHRRMLDAVCCIDAWLAEIPLIPEQTLERIAQRIGFIVFSPVSSDEVGLMFEVINNRGKPLTELEKVKNYLIYYSIKANSGRLREKVDLVWSEILSNLAIADGLRNPDEHLFMRSACIAYFGFRKQESNAAYNSIKKSFPIETAGSDWKELFEFVDFLEKASLFYKELRSADGSNRKRLEAWEGLTPIVDLIGSQKSMASILPCYLSLMALRDAEWIDNFQLKNALSVLEVLNFRAYLSYGGARRSDSGHGELFEVAHRLYSCIKTCGRNHAGDKKTSFRGEFDGLIEKLIAFAQSHSKLSSFYRSLYLERDSSVDFGKWGSLKYFLMNYEQEVNPKKTIRIRDVKRSVDEDKPDDFPSTEHVFARACQVDGLDEDEAGWLKRRLGNFILLELGVNKRARDKSLREKIDIYKGMNGSDMKQVRRVCEDYVEIAEAESYDSPSDVSIMKSLIEKHEARLREFAIERWALPGESLDLHALNQEIREE